MKDRNDFIKVIDTKLYNNESEFTDEDISALFSGVLNIIKEKIFIESESELYRLQKECELLQNALDMKTKELNKIKNKNIYLKTIINNIKINQ